MFYVEIIFILATFFPASPLLSKLAETWDFPKQASIYFNERKEATQIDPAFLRFLLIANTLKQTVQQPMNGMRPIFQRNRFCMTEPLHQQAHRGNMILTIEQGGHDLSKATGRIEVFNMLSPEGDISGRFSRRTPFGKHSSHLSRRFHGLHAFDVRQVINSGCCVAIPMLSQIAEVL